MKVLKVLTYDPKKKKRVLAGTFIDGCFIKKVTAKHFMKVEQGYGVQEDVVQKLIELICETVLIESPTGSYEYPFTELLLKEVKDYGNGPQRFLSIRKKRSVEQLGLFVMEAK